MAGRCATRRLDLAVREANTTGLQYEGRVDDESVRTMSREHRRQAIMLTVSASLEDAMNAIVDALQGHAPLHDRIGELIRELSKP
jgi:hypothetical protein